MKTSTGPTKDKKKLDTDSPGHSVNSLEETKGSSGSDQKGDSYIPFYVYLTHQDWKRLETIARNLNKTKNKKRAYQLAEVAIKLIMKQASEEDMFLIYHLIHNKPEVWSELEEWYFCSPREASRRTDYTPLLRDTLGTETIEPPSLLPRAVEFAMQLGAMSDLSSFSSILLDYYEKYHPEYIPAIAQKY